MKNLNDIINESINEGISAAKYFSAYKGDSVYDHTKVQAGTTRIWISFDIDNDPEKKLRKKLYDWFNQQEQIESWGGSVATFITTPCQKSNDDVLEYLKKELRKSKVFIDDDAKWAETPNISLYVFYRTKDMNKDNYSGHFVLIQNATIKQAGGFKC